MRALRGPVETRGPLPAGWGAWMVADKDSPAWVLLAAWQPKQQGRQGWQPLGALLFLLPGLLRAGFPSDGRHSVLLPFLRSYSNLTRLLTAEGDQAYDVSVVLVGEKNTDLARQALEEKSSKEDIVVLGRRVQLQHVFQQFQWLPATERLNRQEKLHPPEIRHVVACQEDGVWLQGIWGKSQSTTFFSKPCPGQQWHGKTALTGWSPA